MNREEIENKLKEIQEKFLNDEITDLTYFRLTRTLKNQL